jgi:hypothetical protein
MREAVKGMTCYKADVFAHVGTNDVVSRGSEEILSSVRDLSSIALEATVVPT